MRKYIAIAVLFVMIGINFGTASAATDWVPNGTISLTLGDKNLSPVLGSVRDEAFALADVWVNLPAKTAVQVSYWAGLNDSDLDSDKNDEFDIAAWKMFSFGDSGYLKLRLKYFNIFPVSDLNDSDFLSYDVFVGRKVEVDAPINVVAELRVEYWHYLSGFDDGMFTVMPSITASTNVGSVTVYERLGLQWNEEMAPFGQLLSGQASIGLKTKIGDWSWTIVDVSATLPLESLKPGDPREKHGTVAYTTSLGWSF